MRNIIRLLSTAALIVTTSLAHADGHTDDTSTDGLTEAERTVSFNATYVVIGVLLAFLLVNRVNNASD